jgi:hypothetical protein
MTHDKITPDPKKYPEWIEFDGVRFAAKVTAKSIIVHTGHQTTGWGRNSMKMRTREETLRYDTQVTGSRHRWYGIRRGYDDFRTGTPQEMPVDHTEASEKILARLAEVREAVADLDRKVAERRAAAKAERDRRDVWDKWYRQVSPVKDKLDKAVRDGDFDAVDTLARELHALYQEQPSLHEVSR